MPQSSNADGEINEIVGLQDVIFPGQVMVGLMVSFGINITGHVEEFPLLSVETMFIVLIPPVDVPKGMLCVSWGLTSQKSELVVSRVMSGTT